MVWRGGLWWCRDLRSFFRLRALNGEAWRFEVMPRPSLFFSLACLKWRGVAVWGDAETFALFFACVFFCKFSFLRNLALFTNKSNLNLTFVHIFRIDSGEGSDRRCRAVGGSLSRGVKGTSLNNPATTWKSSVWFYKPLKMVGFLRISGAWNARKSFIIRLLRAILRCLFLHLN